MIEFHDAHFLPPEEFIPRPPSDSMYDVVIAVGYDGAGVVVSAPEAFLEWERDKEGAVCNPDTFQGLPKTAGVYRCQLRLVYEIEGEDDGLYMYSYFCEAARSVALRN